MSYSNGSTRISKSGVGLGSGYDSRRRLVAVRRLRIVNMMIECSPTASRVILKSRPSVIALLVARQSLLQGLSKPARDLNKHYDSQEGVKLVKEWAISAINGVMRAIEREAQEKDKAKGFTKQSPALESSILQSDSSTSHSTAISADDLIACCKNPILERLLQLLCGVSAMLEG
jgi:hypothetical protein